MLYPSTRSSAQDNCSAKSLAGNVADSSLSSLSSTGGPGARGFGGRGLERGTGAKGGGGRGHFIHLAIYCTTTWCFTLKGLRTTSEWQLRQASSLHRGTKAPDACPPRVNSTLGRTKDAPQLIITASSDQHCFPVLNTTALNTRKQLYLWGLMIAPHATDPPKVRIQANGGSRVRSGS